MIAKNFERKKKLQKYMNILKPKRRSEDLTYTVKQEDQPTKKKIEKQEHLISKNQTVWEDPDDQDQVNLQSKNISKKLMRGEAIVSQKEYSKMVEDYYQSKQQKEFTSWAVEGEDGDQDQEPEVFQEEFEVVGSTKQSLEFFAKSEYKHRSIISDLCWNKDKLFATGLDKVLSIHDVQNNKLCHGMHFKDLPLTTCSSANGKIYMGTLRKNYIVYDATQMQQQLYSSTFLSEHKTYSNMRVGEKTLSIFSNKLISLFSLNNQFIGELRTNEDVTDLVISRNDLIATTKNSIYRWDNRNSKIVQVVHTGLNNTSVSVVPQSDTLLIGTFSGMIYSHAINPSMKEVLKQIPNLTTSVTGITSTRSGELVAVYSKWKKNGMRIVDMNKYSVLQGWPSVATKLSFPTACCFSDDGKYLSTGSTNGIINTYKVMG